MLPLRGMKNRPGASLPPGVLLCAVLVAVSGNMPADKCPRSLDCAREGRHFCEPGSSHCGPCLAPLEENEEGRCVVRKRHAHIDSGPSGSLQGMMGNYTATAGSYREPDGKVTSFPELDEEIDILSAVIAKQQESEVKQTVKPTQVAPPKASSDGPGHKSPPNSTKGRPRTNAPPTAPLPPPTHPSDRRGPLAVPYPSKDGLLMIMISVCVALGMLALILAAVCWVRMQKETRLTQKVDYPAFSGMASTSSDRISPGDKTLAQSAQMYHYLHQKQQMLSLEKHKEEPKIPDSEATSDEENEDGDFTVYECPGLAPTGEMEVKNPLFDDSTLRPQRNHK